MSDNKIFGILRNQRRLIVVNVLATCALAGGLVASILGMM